MPTLGREQRAGTNPMARFLAVYIYITHKIGLGLSHLERARLHWTPVRLRPMETRGLNDTR